MHREDHKPRRQRLIRRHPVRFFLVTIAGVLAAAVVANLAFAAATRTSSLGSGVVVIETELAYENGEAAGTGIVLSSSGAILTNNHVIRGATSIRVVVPGTGRSYTAKVLGYDIADDVALIRASGASNLTTASIGNSSNLEIGQAVKAVGNAGGTGSLTSATGRVTALRRSITVSDDQGGSSRLTGLIGTDAELQSGDSGGPLYRAGKVVGINTAASVGYGRQQQVVTSNGGFAIPINKAIAIVDQIASGRSATKIHVGATAFLGVTVGTDAYGNPSSGAAVIEVLANGPAANAGIVPGDVITSFAGSTVGSPNRLSSLVLTKKVGARVAVTYVDQAGASHRVTVTLGSGPPQ